MMAVEKIKMFGNRAPEKFDPSEYRAHNRRSAKGLRAFADGHEIEILDYSEGGMRVHSPYPLPRVTVIEIYKGENLIRTMAAVVAWARGDQTGYSFRAKQKVTMIDTPAPKSRDVALPEKNRTGGVSGSALRQRLKL